MKTVSEADVGRLDPRNIIDIDLASDEMRQGARRGLLAEWATMAPFYVVNNGVPQVVVTRYADVKTVLTDREHFTVRPPRVKGYERFDYFNGADSIAQMDGAEHDRVRSTLTPSFTPRFLAKVEENVGGIVETMLDEVEARGTEFDCMGDFANHLIVRIVLGGFLGMTPEQQKALVHMHEAFSLIIDIPPGGAYPEAYLKAQQDAYEVIAEMIAERRANPRDLDFISSMIATQQAAGTINDEELVSNIFAIIGAGQGTTSTATGAMLMNLCKHRDQFDEVIANRALIPQVVEECLRYQGSGYLTFPRFALHDCEIGGTPILEGMPVNVMMQCANYDPTEYPEPLKFDIHRNPRNILTFGTGSHHCLGNRLARKVMMLILDKVCDRFPNLRLQDPTFEPHYGGMFGELKPDSIPMHTGR